MQLMVRPCYPPFYPQGQMPDCGQLSDVIVIVDHLWKVGDLVDWWCEGCYWCATVTHLLDNDKVQLELPEPPIGEGKSYQASSKDLRPSLDWSLEHGWTVPISRESGSCYCARLVRPLNEGTEKTNKNIPAENTTDKEREGNCNLVDRSGSVSLEAQTSSSSNVLLGSLVPLNGHGAHCLTVPSTSMNLDNAHSLENSNSVEKCSSSRDELEYVSGVRTHCSSRSRYYSSDGSKRMTIKDDRQAGTIDSSIMELEELANKIRWLKELLQFGFQWSNSKKPSWKFLEAHGS